MTQLRFLLAIPPEAEVKFERFSDSAGTYVTLDSNNPSVYKQLFRAAKAKSKLRLRATILNGTTVEAPQLHVNNMNNVNGEQRAEPSHPNEGDTATHSKAEVRPSYLATVLASPPPPTADAVPVVSCQQAGQSEVGGSEAATGSPRKLTTDVSTILSSSAGVDDWNRTELAPLSDMHANSFSIDCNNCGKSIPNVHYHCSICEAGDFDLCQACVDTGTSCQGEEHWLIKRFIRQGMIVPSITMIAPKKNQPDGSNPEQMDEKPIPPAEPLQPVADRTCNSCISGTCLHPNLVSNTDSWKELPNDQFVTCLNCPDFDLCLPCFKDGQHGHHPAHAFRPVLRPFETLPPEVQALCSAGRGVQHDAICDGCDKVRLPRPFLLCHLLTGGPAHCWRSVQVLDVSRLGLLCRVPPQR